jgi:hypothetical protein
MLRKSNNYFHHKQRLLRGSSRLAKGVGVASILPFYFANEFPDSGLKTFQVSAAK